MTAAAESPTPPPRVPTGIAGLDTILRGGLLRGGLYAVVGPPGAGKTILGNQLCFHHVATGGRALYITLLTEAHGLLFSYLSSLTFFDPTLIGAGLRYYSAYHELEEGGLAGLRDYLRTVVRQDKSTLLVLDGFAPFAATAAGDLDLHRFLAAVQVQGAASGCTTLLLMATAQLDATHPAYAMVDGVIALDDRRVGPRAVRELSVPKLRGSGYLRGGHACAITDAGLVVYPRIEALLARPSRAITEGRARHAFGIAGLDAMLHGGVLAGSTTLLLGEPGTGKTLTGTSFLVAGAAAGERGLYFGFFESPARLIGTVDGVGLALSRHVADGTIALVWRPPLEASIDALAGELLTAVRERGVRRLFIDGLDGFARTAVEPERIDAFFTALSNELRALAVTTVVSLEQTRLFDPTVEAPITGVSATFENLLLLRTVELRAQLHRLVSIVKVRESGYDTAIREFRISAQGIDVAATFASAEAVLTDLEPPAPPPTTGTPAAPPFDAGPER
jgi:circadian clock protein KaiC